MSAGANSLDVAGQGPGRKALRLRNCQARSHLGRRHRQNDLQSRQGRPCNFEHTVSKDLHLFRSHARRAQQNRRGRGQGGTGPATCALNAQLSTLNSSYPPCAQPATTPANHNQGLKAGLPGKASPHQGPSADLE